MSTIEIRPLVGSAPGADEINEVVLDKTGFILSDEGSNAYKDYLFGENQDLQLADAIGAVTVTGVTLHWAGSNAGVGNPVPVAATLTTALTGTNNDLVYTAKTAGAAGNAITVAYAQPTSNGSISVAVSGSAITVTPAFAGKVNLAAASFTTSFVTANSNLTYTARTAGAPGNFITITYVNPGTAGPLSVEVLGGAITVTLASDGSNITSTAYDIVMAIAASSPANALVTVGYTSGSGTGLVSALSTNYLANGADAVVGAITSTATQVAAAIAASSLANALVSVANAASNDGSGVVTALSATQLSGGNDDPGGGTAIKPAIKLGGDIYYGTPNTTLGDVSGSWVMTTNPATGDAWAVADLDTGNVQFGAAMQGVAEDGGSAQAKLYQVWMEVAFTKGAMHDFQVTPVESSKRGGGTITVNIFWTPDGS
jgi:hypothetical protein